ncbi:hypothetical protein ACIOHC_36200 [Streptomyces sp. NPDC088252]|uniref:hypothetical protein n=1 Tax=Streptomyces sp. NPDC088252 TaxID=3365845 RepID=UPI003812ECAA
MSNFEFQQLGPDTAELITMNADGVTRTIWEFELVVPTSFKFTDLSTHICMRYGSG